MENQHPHPIIIIKDVKYEDIRNIIRFIYTGEVSVPQHELQDFLRTAELLEIKGLLKNPSPPSSSTAAAAAAEHHHAVATTNAAAETIHLTASPMTPPPPPSTIQLTPHPHHAHHHHHPGGQPQPQPPQPPPPPQLPTVPVSSVLLGSTGPTAITDGGDFC